jgi:hypothetical protein
MLPRTVCWERWRKEKEETKNHAKGFYGEIYTLVYIGIGVHLR